MLMRIPATCETRSLNEMDVPGVALQVRNAYTDQRYRLISVKDDHSPRLTVMRLVENLRNAVRK
jgi:hypothetical protein